MVLFFFQRSLQPSRYMRVGMVEIRRFELLTSCLQGRRSPNWAIPPYIIKIVWRFFSLERRWSSRTFRYGYLVTTSPQSLILPSTAATLRFAHRLRVLQAPMVWRAVCTRPGNAFTAAFWSAITSNSDFMFSSCREQSELRPSFWGLLDLAISLLFVTAIVARVLPRAYRAWWFDVIPTFLRFIIGSLSRVPIRNAGN